MLNQLVRAGDAFPNRLFVAVSLLLCLCADGAWAAQTRKPASTTDCASASNKNWPPCVVESPTGQVIVFWPKLRASNVAQVIESKMEVWIDKARVGIVKDNAPLTVSVPNGPHTLALKPYDDFLENIRPIRETQITVSAQKPLYLQIIHQGWTINASELDAPTAQAVLSGGEPKDAGNASPSQAAAPQAGGSPAAGSQAAVSDKEPKDKAEILPSLAAFFTGETKTSNEAKAPSGPPATIHLYWPRPALDFGFLDRFNTAVPVYLNGRRIGAVATGDYLVLKVPSGEHVLALDVGLSSGRLLKQDFILGAGTTRYFHVQHHDEYRMMEDSPEEAADYGKGLKQREVAAQ